MPTAPCDVLKGVAVGLFGPECRIIGVWGGGRMVKMWRRVGDLNCAFLKTGTSTGRKICGNRRERNAFDRIGDETEELIRAMGLGSLVLWCVSQLASGGEGSGRRNPYPDAPSAPGFGAPRSGWPRENRGESHLTMNWRHSSLSDSLSLTPSLPETSCTGGSTGGMRWHLRKHPMESN